MARERCGVCIRCALCGRRRCEPPRQKVWIDHDRATDATRDLCNPCNEALRRVGQ